MADIKVKVATIRGQEDMGTYTVKADDTVKTLKEKVVEKNGGKLSQYKFIHKDTKMEDGRKLSFYDIEDGSTVGLVLTLGGRRRTRKTRRRHTRRRRY
jgi:hypothetical protein